MHLVFTSVSKKAQAQAMAKAVISCGLAACASFWPVHSVYRWKAKLASEEEFVLEIKTARPALVKSWLAQNHPYQMPVVYAVRAGRVPAAVQKWLAKP